MKECALIIGGTSGLGLELAGLFSHDLFVIVTGRQDPKVPGIHYFELDLADPSPRIYNRLNRLVGLPAAEVPPSERYLEGLVPEISLLVYAAGFYQEGIIDELDDEAIDAMNSVGLGACQKILARILRKQGKLGGFIAVTSTSEWTPRLKEPVYCGVKAGLKLFSEAVSLDPRIGKTLVAAPAGMATPFWRDTPRDTSDMLDPKWVSTQIMELYKNTDGRYTHARILRNPPRVVLESA